MDPYLFELGIILAWHMIFLSREFNDYLQNFKWPSFIAENRFLERLIFRLRIFLKYLCKIIKFDIWPDEKFSWISAWYLINNSIASSLASAEKELLIGRVCWSGGFYRVTCEQKKYKRCSPQHYSLHLDPIIFLSTKRTSLILSL